MSAAKIHTMKQTTQFPFLFDNENKQDRNTSLSKLDISFNGSLNIAAHLPPLLPWTTRVASAALICNDMLQRAADLFYYFFFCARLLSCPLSFGAYANNNFIKEWDMSSIKSSLCRLRLNKERYCFWVEMEKEFVYAMNSLSCDG